DELNGAFDTVRQIEHLARTKNNLLASARARDMETARAEIVGTIAAHHDLEHEPEPHVRGLAFKVKSGLKRAAAEHTKMEFLFRALDGSKAGGVVWQYLFKP